MALLVQESDKPCPNKSHPFALWMAEKVKSPAELRDMLQEHNISKATAYRWANGEQLPGSRHLEVYELFLRETGKMKRGA